MSEEKTINLYTITYNEEEYMKVKDIITWLKVMQKDSEKYKGIFHYLITCLIKMKNSPTIKT